MGHTAIFVPELADIGTSLACIVTQTDESGLILAQKTVAAVEPFNLFFPPQPADPGQVLVQGEASSYLTSLEIGTVEKRDLAAIFSLNVANPYGFQIYKFSLSAEPTTTATTERTTTTGSLSPEESNTKDGRNTAGVVVVLLVLAIISVGALLLYRRRKAADGEMAPLTTP